MTTRSPQLLGSQLSRCVVMRSGYRRLPYCLIPVVFAPRQPLLGLSSQLHVARRPTASCDKPSCPLTTSFLILAGETWGVAACVCVCVCVLAHTAIKGTSSKKKSCFQMTKHRLFGECLLRLVFVFSPSFFQESIIVSVCLSFPRLPRLHAGICISVILGCNPSHFFKKCSCAVFSCVNFLASCFTFFNLFSEDLFVSLPCLLGVCRLLNLDIIP